MANILITGAGRGFGQLITDSLLNKGHTVVATMRDTQGRNSDSASAFQQKGAIVVEMDVTSSESVDAAVQTSLRTTGGIDVVINNAGVGVLGLQEAFTIEDWHRIFDINVFGVQRVIRAVLPHMREKRSGLLISISSLLGRFVLPFYGPYNASKHALEAMADNYRIELSGFGIESIIVEPGAFGTEFSAGLLRPSDTARTASYGPMADIPEAGLKSFEQHLHSEHAPKPQWVADAVVKLIDTPRGERPFRTIVDGMGMGNAIAPYNQAAEQAQAGIYGAMGISHLLKLNTD